METTKQGKDKQMILHPSFFQYLSVFTVPLVLFLFVPFGVKICYVLPAFWVFELFLLFCIWVFLAMTTYVIRPDRIEIRGGIFVRRSTAVPLDKIVNITCQQNLFQKLFGIGDLFIEIPGLEPFEITLTGIEKHQKVADFLFVLIKGSGT
jgi:uncharacterized membrane protein YdbT with pleckstrin-like domain